MLRLASVNQAQIKDINMFTMLAFENVSKLVGTFFLLCCSNDISQEWTVTEVGFLFDFQYCASTFCWSWKHIPALSVPESNTGIMVEHLLIWLH
jgi:hypothetical protein